MSRTGWSRERQWQVEAGPQELCRTWGLIPRSWERLGGLGAGGSSGRLPRLQSSPAASARESEEGRGKQAAPGLDCWRGRWDSRGAVPTAVHVPGRWQPWGRRPWMLEPSGCPSSCAQALPQPPSRAPPPRGIFSKCRRWRAAAHQEALGRLPCPAEASREPAAWPCLQQSGRQQPPFSDEAQGPQRLLVSPSLKNNET